MDGAGIILVLVIIIIAVFVVMRYKPPAPPPPGSKSPPVLPPPVGCPATACALGSLCVTGKCVCTPRCTACNSITGVCSACAGGGAPRAAGTCPAPPVVVVCPTGCACPSGSSACPSCVPGYHPDGSGGCLKDLACTGCGPAPDACDVATGLCRSCPDGSWLNEADACVPDLACANCDTCNVETGGCSQCSAGYHADGGGGCAKCACVPGSACAPDGSCACLGCAAGSGACQADGSCACPNCGAGACDATTGLCTACAEYFTEQGGGVCGPCPTCVLGGPCDSGTGICPCNDPNGGCAPGACGPTGACAACASGFYMAGGVCNVCGSCQQGTPCTPLVTWYPGPLSATQPFTFYNTTGATVYVASTNPDGINTYGPDPQLGGANAADVLPLPWASLSANYWNLYTVASNTSQVIAGMPEAGDFGITMLVYATQTDSRPAAFYAGRSAAYYVSGGDGTLGCQTFVCDGVPFVLTGHPAAGLAVWTYAGAAGNAYYSPTSVNVPPSSEPAQTGCCCALDTGVMTSDQTLAQCPGDRNGWYGGLDCANLDPNVYCPAPGTVTLGCCCQNWMDGSYNTHYQQIPNIPSAACLNAAGEHNYGNSTWGPSNPTCEGWPCP